MTSKVRVEYENLYQYVCASDDIYDFHNRIQTLSAEVMTEFANRITEKRPMSAWTIASMVDNMQEEVRCLISNINTTDIVQDVDQTKVMEDMFLALIKLYNPILYRDYLYVKQGSLN